MRKFIFLLIVSFTAFSQADSSVGGGNRNWEFRTYKDNNDEVKYFSYNSVLIPYDNILEHAYDIHRNRYFKLFARDTFKVRSLAPDKAISSNPTYVVGHGADTILHSYILESFIVPSVRALTINGTTQSLSTDRTWNVGDLFSSGSYSNPTWLTALSDSKITWSGTSLQYVRGDGQKGTMPTSLPPSGTAGGDLTGTYASAFSSIPNVQPFIRGQTNDKQFCMLTSSTTTGFTVKVVQRNTINIIGVGLVLLETVSNVNGATVDVIVTEK